MTYLQVVLQLCPPPLPTSPHFSLSLYHTGASLFLLILITTLPFPRDILSILGMPGGQVCYLAAVFPAFFLPARTFSHVCLGGGRRGTVPSPHVPCLPPPAS